MVRVPCRAEPTAPALFGSVRFDHGLLDAVDGKDVGAVMQITAGVNDVRSSGETEGVEDQVAAAGHSSWGGTRNSTIVHWPNRIMGKGEIRSQFRL